MCKTCDYMSFTPAHMEQTLSCSDDLNESWLWFDLCRIHSYEIQVVHKSYSPCISAARNFTPNGGAYSLVFRMWFKSKFTHYPPVHITLIVSSCWKSFFFFLGCGVAHLHSFQKKTICKNKAGQLQKTFWNEMGWPWVSSTIVIIKCKHLYVNEELGFD